MDLSSERLRLIPLTRRQMQTGLLRWTALERELQLKISGRVWNERLRESYRSQEGKMAGTGKNYIWYTYWQIVDRASERIVGEIGFKGMPDGFGCVEIGYQTHHEYQNRGYMSEAMSLLLEWASGQSGVESVTARVRRDNAASQRVLTKLGFACIECGAEERWSLNLKKRVSAEARGRFAPSPSGEMHLGNAWTGLLAWLQIRARNGAMVLRIEDLDPERSKEIYIEGVKQDLRWLGLDWDEGEDAGGAYGPYRQSQRRELYKNALDKLTAKGLTYRCLCTRAQLAASAPHQSDGERVYSGLCRDLPEEAAAEKRAALRLRVPEEDISFLDALQGTIRQDLAREVGDFVLRRADGVHAYQLAVVVDDAAMKISHVLRGDDLLSSTPRQLLLYRILGLEAPQFSHVPLLLGADGHRLSKRHQDLSLAALRRGGAKPETILGWLGWKAGLLEKCAPVTARELLSVYRPELLPRCPVSVETEIRTKLINGD